MSTENKGLQVCYTHEVRTAPDGFPVAEYVAADEPKKQTFDKHFIYKFVMLLLSLLLVACVVAILLSGGFGGSAGVLPPPIKHEFPRSSRDSLNPALEYELNIGGSGIDTVSTSYLYKENHYIFGTTASTDCDMQSPLNGLNLFVSVVAGDGAYSRNIVFGSDQDDTLIAVRMYKSGFLALANNSRSDGAFDLYHIPYTTLAPVLYEFNYPTNYTALDLYTNGDRFVIVAQNIDYNISKKSLMLLTLDQDFSLRKQQVVTHSSGSILYDSIYPSASGWTVAATMSEGPKMFPCFISVSDSEGALFRYIERDGKNARLLSVTPVYEGGWALLCARADTDFNAYVTLLNIDFAVVKATELSTTHAPDGTIVETGKFLAVNVASSAGSSRVTLLDKNIAVLPQSMQALDNLGTVTDAIVTDTSVILLSTTASGNLVLASVNLSSKKTARFAVSGNKPDSAVCITADDNNNLYILANSYSWTDSYGGNFGQLDVWSAKISAAAKVDLLG